MPCHAMPCHAMSFHYHHILCFALLSLLSLSSTSGVFVSELFDCWCRYHGKIYPSEQEKLHRLEVFEDNYAFITQHNSDQNSTYALALNAFADLTHLEFRSTKLGLGAKSNLDRRRHWMGGSSSVLEVPSAVDWRKEGAVTRVKDQGSCGACWSFSTTGAIEGINKIVTGSLVSLSEQELVDCDKTFNAGCGGGLMDYAFQFVVKNKGIDTEEDYPYAAKDRPCNKEKLKRRVVTIDGYVDVPQNNEKQLLKAVASQPVSVGICGSERAFQLYSKGIFTGPCSTALDHAVLIVGYGSDNGVDYWIVKNSWGPSWGMKGYIHMLRNGGGSSQGLCGINMLASYPTKTSPNPPPSPSPGPTKCDLFNYCPEGQTCCCTNRFVGVCLSWRCCNVDSAVCCKDNKHCCPQDYPVCDTKRSRCLKKYQNGTGGEVPGMMGSNPKRSKWGDIVVDWIL